MEAGMNFSGIWLLHIAALSILDAKLFAKPPEGERKVGTLVWGIVVLAVAGLTALSDMWGLISLLTSIEMLSWQPVLWVLQFLASAAELTVCVFLILGGVARIRNQAPRKAVLKVILGACLGGLALTLMVATAAMGGMYYY